ncbi:MAG: primosomal protein N' [Bacteroidetes bacterium]|nr:primosomal protein N' [Bacteroidota bacterium]
MSQKQQYAQVALNVPIDSLFTYKIPSHFTSQALPGSRVIVNFGNKILTGVVFELTDKAPVIKVKDIRDVLDEKPILSKQMLSFCKWVSQYYIAPIGEVVFLCIPRNINIKTDIFYQLAPDYVEKLNESKLRDNFLFDILDYIKNHKSAVTKKQVEKKFKYNDLSKQINALLESGVIYNESLYSKPTKEKIIKLVNANFPAENYQSIVKENKVSSEKQKKFLEEVLKYKDKELNELMKETGIGAASVNSLALKNLVIIKEVRKIRTSEEIFEETEKNVTLNSDQQNALNEINEAIDSEKFTPFLLFGVTGSGKTEVYINAAKHALLKGKSAIILVPEISLTPQLIHRFKSRFGDKIGVIHSKLSDGERLDTFDRIKNGYYKIIIGARSALFAPVKNPGLIVVDEEHDTSYKQENSPRYHGRDSALVRGKFFECAVVLGSATPSMESFYNADTGKYKLLTLSERAGNFKMPFVKIVDLNLREKLKEKEYIESETNFIKKDFFDLIDKVRLKFLSKDLLVDIDKRLERKESIIILQNRRGFHTYIECMSCNNVEMCPRCSIALTYHKAIDLLKCHYCGFAKKKPQLCTNCGAQKLVEMGAGTERVEEELIKLFPEAEITRMDSDSLTSKNQYQKILKDFYDKKIDILVGTQIISKGLDFPDVTLVGVVNADIGLLNPDFRAGEKTFQILTQVAGRSGRAEKEGEVLIQTTHPEYFLFGNVKEHDYLSFYKNEIRTREAANYPPFSRVALIEIKCEDRILAESKIKEVFNFVKMKDENRLLDMLPPNPPLFSKLRDMYRYHLLIKSPKQKDAPGSYLNSVLRAVKIYADKNLPTKTHLTIDVDAVNLL